MVKGITEITVQGFKSLAEAYPIKVRPLTILAGANSSGKTSIMQPLLMMKQTLLESYDPGDLKINGPNVRFTKIEQFLSKNLDKSFEASFSVKIEVDDNRSLMQKFAKQQDKGIKLVESIYKWKNREVKLSSDMTQEDILTSNDFVRERYEKNRELFVEDKITDEIRLIAERHRCFLKLFLQTTLKKSKDIDDAYEGFRFPVFLLSEPYEAYIAEIIHVPALRGNPRRDYEIAAVGPIFPGTFENYVASIIKDWQTTNISGLNTLFEWLRMLNLTHTVVAEQIDDTRVEIRVGRLPVGTDPALNDLVSIADVGFGVSQTLPVLVALLVAKPGQLVYIEQPEVHLHPRAQIAMAEVLANAAKRGIRVVVETHSALLLRGIQTVVANGDIIPAEEVILHWFERDVVNGTTKIRSADLDKAGSFGDWPVDFGEVLMKAESDYIQAAEPHLRMD